MTTNNPMREAGGIETERKSRKVAKARPLLAQSIVYSEPEVRRQLKMLAAELGTTQQKLWMEALNLLFQRHGKPPIAS